jgi:hypothetical protein
MLAIADERLPEVKSVARPGSCTRPRIADTLLTPATMTETSDDIWRIASEPPMARRKWPIFDESGKID